MSSSLRSTNSSTRHTWVSARLQKDSRTPSPSQHQVTPPSRVLTPLNLSQHQIPTANRRVSPPRQNLFTSIDPQDDDSIHSIGSEEPTMMVIELCQDFTKYGVWLKKHFPKIIQPISSFFVHSHLRIRNSEDIEEFMNYTLKTGKISYPDHIIFGEESSLNWSSFGQSLQEWTMISLMPNTWK